MRRVLLVAGALVLMVATLWIVLRRERSPEASRAEERAPEVARAAARAELVTTDERAAADRAEVARTSPETPLPVRRAAEDESVPVSVLFRGLIVDALDGRAIVGARVDREPRASGMDVSDVLGDPEAMSGADGRFALTFEGAALRWALAAADGYGATRVLVERGHEAVADELVIELTPAARLDVIVRDEHGAPVNACKVTARSSDEFVFRPSTVMTGKGLTWTRDTDATGRATFAEIPAETTLALVLDTRGRKIELGSLALAPGEARTLEYALCEARVGGRIRSSSGASVAGIRVGLLRPEAGLHEAERLDAMADADGAYVIEHVPYGTYWLVELSSSVVNMRAKRVEVRADRPDVRADLLLEPAYEISGRVVAPDGESLGFEGVSAVSVGPSTRDVQSVACDSDGAFRLRGLRAGLHRLTVSGAYGAWRGPEVDAGRSDVELRLPAPSDVTILVATEEDLSVVVLADEAGSLLWTEGERGEVELALYAGRYSVLCTAVSGRLAFLPRLEVGASAPPRPIELTPSAGARLTVVVGAVGRGAHLCVRCDGGLVADAAAEAGAAKTFLVPGGVLDVELSAGGSIVAAAQVTLAPLERLRVVLEPR